MNYFFSIITGYLLGSVPTAYLVLKATHGLDITKAGSGNVGAMNSFKVTRSKKIAIIVFLVDALKGWLSAFIVYAFLSNEFQFPALALASAVLGHCFSPWLNFKGGRGLATAAGGALFITIPILITWASVWLITFIFQRNIHTGNIIASIFSIVASFIIPGSLLDYSALQTNYSLYYSILVSVIMLIILIKHHPTIQEFFQKIK